MAFKGYGLKLVALINPNRYSANKTLLLSFGIKSGIGRFWAELC